MSTAPKSNDAASIIHRNCYNWLSKVDTNDGKKGIWFRLAERNYNHSNKIQMLINLNI